MTARVLHDKDGWRWVIRNPDDPRGGEVGSRALAFTDRANAANDLLQFANDLYSEVVQVCLQSREEQFQL